MTPCPTCGGATEVITTRGSPTRRQLACIQNPKHPRLFTVEIPTEEYNSLQSALFRNNFLMAKLNELITTFNHGEKK